MGDSAPPMQEWEDDDHHRLAMREARYVETGSSAEFSDRALEGEAGARLQAPETQLADDLDRELEEPDLDRQLDRDRQPDTASPGGEQKMVDRQPRTASPDGAKIDADESDPENAICMEQGAADTEISDDEDKVFDKMTWADLVDTTDNYITRAQIDLATMAKAVKAMKRKQACFTQQRRIVNAERREKRRIIAHAIQASADELKAFADRSDRSDRYANSST